MGRMQLWVCVSMRTPDSPRLYENIRESYDTHPHRNPSARHRKRGEKGENHNSDRLPAHDSADGMDGPPAIRRSSSPRSENVCRNTTAFATVGTFSICHVGWLSRCVYVPIFSAGLLE